LKQMSNSSKANVLKNLDRILVSLFICNKRLQMHRGELFTGKVDLLEFEMISENVYYWIAENKLFSDSMLGAAWLKKLQKQYKDATAETVQTDIKETLA